MNSLIQPYALGVQARFKCALVDPRSVVEDRRRFRRDYIGMLGRANSVYVPSGRWPMRGWILLSRGDYNNLNKYSNAFQLEIGDSTTPNNVAALTNLSFVQAQCVTRGLASDPNAIYLVELTDDRGVLHNKWFQAPITAYYNIRAPAYPQTFYSLSMNGGSAWTWSTMLQDMWGKLNTLGGGSVLGAWPGLPSAPTGTPEGWWFVGVPGWYALCDILDMLGMTVACDLTQDNPYTIVTAGAADAVFSALQTKFGRTNHEDDQEWIDVGAGRVPSSVQVLFRRRNQYYGTEETVRNDGLQWTTTPYYSVTVASPATFSGAVGTAFIWSDFTVEYDLNNNPLAADVTSANAIAAERALQYFGKIYRQTAGYMTRTYAGALPFATGALVDGVKWHQDYSSQDRQGWKTSIMRGDFLSWAELAGE
jgi:hypothetical protein